jgi:hypothetical protein
MPVILGTGTFNVGRDCQVVVNGPDGRDLQIDNITEFEIDPAFMPIKIDLLNGVQMNAQLPKGGSGHIAFERNGPAIDRFFANLENTWYQQGLYRVGSIDQYIAERRVGVVAHQHRDDVEAGHVAWRPVDQDGDQLHV